MQPLFHESFPDSVNITGWVRWLCGALNSDLARWVHRWSIFQWPSHWCHWLLNLGKTHQKPSKIMVKSWFSSACQRTYSLHVFAGLWWTCGEVGRGFWCSRICLDSHQKSNLFPSGPFLEVSQVVGLSYGDHDIFRGLEHGLDPNGV